MINLIQNGILEIFHELCEIRLCIMLDSLLVNFVPPGCFLEMWKMHAIIFQIDVFISLILFKQQCKTQNIQFTIMFDKGKHSIIINKMKLATV